MDKDSILDYIQANEEELNAKWLFNRDIKKEYDTFYEFAENEAQEWNAVQTDMAYDAFKEDGGKL